MTTFVAIDGEGLTRGIETCVCEGKLEHNHAPQHDYTLLAASDGSYIEDYGMGGLGTEECFEYLLQLGERHKGVVLCGFYTSYDVNMLFRDLPESVLAGLWEGRMRSWRAKEGDYKQYRIEYVPNRVLKIQQGCWTMGEDDTIPKWSTFRSVVWWDCFQFFQQSFVKALRDWKAADEKTIDEIERMKGLRGEFQAGQEAEIRAYCQKECELLVGMMQRLADTLDELDIKLTSWYGAGSIASALFKQHGIKKHIKRDWDGENVLPVSADGRADESLPTTSISDAIMRAYFGGRVETFAVGVVGQGCYNWDVRSAYPSAMRSLPSLEGCTVSHVSGSGYDYQEPYAIWRVVWRATTRPVKLTPFPFRHKKRIHWPHTGEGWYHAEEVRAAFDVFGAGDASIALSVVEGYTFHPANDRMPFDWVPDLYDERAAYKARGDAREKPLKLGLNSLYGKCAQSIGGKNGEPPPFQCYLWAGMITARCRAMLLRAAAKSDNVLAIATDGLFVGDEIDLPEGEGLGDWECQTVEPGLMLIQPGVYASPSLGKTKGSFAKSRGFSAKGIEYQALLSQWRTTRMSASQKMSETRFIGFGYALAVGKLNTLWRRWVSGEKTIHFSGTTSKSFDPTRPVDTELVYLVAPNAPADGLSDAYVPRTRSKDDAKEFELQAELLASQPDLDDNMFVWRE